MKLIPAIDIMQGRVVRLIQGDPQKATYYDDYDTAVEAAERWETEGASRLHVVDLDAALGTGDNSAEISDIIDSIEIPIQVGGGIRNLGRARFLLDHGVHSVILGSLPFAQPDALKELLEEYTENRVIVALDHLDGNVMIHGWTEFSGRTLDESVSYFRELGAEIFLVTSIAHDGTMSGPSLDMNPDLSNSGAKIISSGGVRRLGDLVALKNRGVYGVVVGKALYDGAFTLREALAAIER